MSSIDPPGPCIVLRHRRSHAGLRGVLVTQADKLRLREAFGAQCVDMESAAYAQVCYANDTPLTIIKTVTDQCDENGFENFEKNVAHCSTISATTLLGLIGREHAA
ncbi:MAG: hypothetical protein IPN40_15535 [Uliginosibacterium sp.]|nr:hypothetical protein [Uliginosibacterium sp.]